MITASLLLSSTASSEECKWSTALGVDEVTPCSGVLVPPIKLKNALACKKVRVPQLIAERDKCLRDFDIMKKSWDRKESLLLNQIKKEQESSKLTSTILTTSVAVLSGILLGILL